MNHERLKNHTPAIVVAALAAVALLACGGCSDELDGPVAPPAPEVQASPFPQFEGLDDDEILARIRDLVEDTAIEVLPGHRGGDGLPPEIMPEMRTSPEKYVALPNGLLVGGVASLAMGQINAGTYNPSYTVFVHEDGEVWGLQVVWEETIDANHFYQYCFADISLESPSSYQYVTPYTSAVYDAAVRAIQAMHGDPTSCTDRYYESNAAVPYWYEFTYPDGDGSRRFRISKIAVEILEGGGLE